MARLNRDNHWWDCVVGATVAASVLGLRWDAGTAAGAPPVTVTRKKVRLSDKFREKHGAIY